MSNNQGYEGALAPNTTGSGLNAQAFLINQILAQISTATLVQVQAVTNAGGISPVGTVDVLPLVNQVDGVGNAVPHGTVYGLPYFRLQGGTNAVILDPQVGDIGIAVFADRDLSSVKANKGQANPGSRRKFSKSDGLYIGGVLNGTPAQYVDFAAGGITVVSPTKITCQAPEIDLTATSKVVITAPTTEIDSPTIVLNGQVYQGTGTTKYPATLQGPVTVINDLTAQGTDVHTHTHTGTQPGSGNSGPPA